MVVLLDRAEALVARVDTVLVARRDAAEPLAEQAAKVAQGQAYGLAGRAATSMAVATCKMADIGRQGRQVQCPRRIIKASIMKAGSEGP